MTNDQIENRLGKLIRVERKLTKEILHLICKADERRLYLDRGYSSLFDWLTKHFGFSEPAAQRRIQAARLLRAAPEVSSKLEEGSLNLTTLSKAQSEHILVELLPASGLSASRETKTMISENLSRLALNVSNEVLKGLERAKELLSHVFPEGASSANVIGYVLKDFLKRRDPLKKKPLSVPSKEERLSPERSAKNFVAAKQCVTPQPSLSENIFDLAKNSPPNETTKSGRITPSERASSPSQRVRKANRRALPAALRRAVFQRDRGRCSFEDPRTNARPTMLTLPSLSWAPPMRAFGGDGPR